MKKSIRTIGSKVLAAAFGTALLAALLFACADPITPIRESGNDIPAGKGIVRIDTGTGTARTAMPDLPAFDLYEFWFSNNGGTAVQISPLPDDRFELGRGPTGR